jgi:hypothetical protein
MAERPLTHIPSYKDNPKKVFELYREAGRIPTQFTSFEHAGAAFQAAMKSGLSAQKAREALGLTHKSVAGSYLFGKTPVLDKNKRPVPGQFSYFNPRAINEDIDPTTEMYVRRNYGDDAYTRFHSKLNQDWTQFSELERKHVQGLTGKQFHRGHGWAASARGGSVSQNNMYAEHGQRNVLHSSGDRWPDAVMRDLGIPKNNIEAYYADPNRSRLRTSHAVAMDDDWTAMNPDGRGFHRRPGSLNPFNAEILSDKLDQLEAQGLSREGIDRAIMERSATLSQSNSVSRSGPVRTTKVDPRSMGSVKVTKPTRAQLEAQRLATTRYGIPAPKPAPRPVGSQATLNGKPVVWNGSSWKPMMPNRLTTKRVKAPAATRPQTREPQGNSPLEMLNRLVNSTQDALKIHPGMSLPSVNLIQGI